MAPPLTRPHPDGGFEWKEEMDLELGYLKNKIENHLPIHPFVSPFFVLFSSFTQGWFSICLRSFLKAHVICYDLFLLVCVCVEYDRNMDRSDWSWKKVQDDLALLSNLLGSTCESYFFSFSFFWLTRLYSSKSKEAKTLRVFIQHHALSHTLKKSFL